MMKIAFIVMILTFLFVGYIAVKIQYKARPILPVYQEKFERIPSRPFQKKQLNPNLRRTKHHTITSC